MNDNEKNNGEESQGNFKTYAGVNSITMVNMENNMLFVFRRSWRSLNKQIQHSSESGS
jgi:hypothetical protein